MSSHMVTIDNDRVYKDDKTNKRVQMLLQVLRCDKIKKLVIFKSMIDIDHRYTKVVITY